MAVIDLVKWDTNNPRLLVWKYPSSELSTWTQLIVNDTQQAWLVHEGNYEGPFNAGRHVLSTENLPILSKVLNLPFGGKSPFTSEVWFVTKKEVLDLKWGTMQPMQLMDPVYGVLLPVRAFSQYGIRIVNGRKLLAKLVGTASMFTADQINNYFRGAISSRIKSYISEHIVQKKIPIFELSAHLEDMSQELPQQLNETLAGYGVEIVRFNLMSISVPEDDSSVKELKSMLAQKAKLNVLGGNYQQVRSFDVLEGAAHNEGTAGAFLGVGMGAAFNNTIFGGGAGGGSPVLNTNPPPAGNATSAPQPKPAMSMAEKISTLKQLAELLKAGILTETEFQEEKRKILQ